MGQEGIELVGSIYSANPGRCGMENWEGGGTLLKSVQAILSVLEDWPWWIQGNSDILLALLTDCDLGLVCPPLCTSTIPSLQWGQGWGLNSETLKILLSPVSLSTGLLMSLGAGKTQQSWEVAHSFPSIGDGNMFILVT